MKPMLFAAAAAAFLMTAMPVAAQDVYPLKPGNYWDVTGIHVDDGAGLTYANHLANIYSRNMDMQKAKGYIQGYHILGNENPREGEPDFYLIVVFDKMVDTAEQERRGAEMRASMKTTMEQMAADSGKRADYRKVGSNMLLRELSKR